MEKSLTVVALCVGFVVLDTVKSFPIDISSVGEGGSNPLWLTYYFLTVLGFFLIIVSIIFGCMCCQNGKGFKEFSNSTGNLAVSRCDGFVNPNANSELTIFPPLGANSNDIFQFEPLPDIKYQSQNLRPAAFSYSEQEISSSDWFVDYQSSFPRSQLKYVQEYGRGWFGRVVEGEAQNIIPEEKMTKVMVKILHEDATSTDQMYFLHEVKFYRDLKHPNILRLLGQCLETEPFLIILECYPNGDLKSFLSQNLASAQALVEQGVTLQMCSNITSGLQFMHENKFIHTDLAARNCLVGPDLTVKIGDYGNSIEIFKTDYYCAGSVALPVRWCAPETLKCTDITIETREVTPPANIWSLGVVFWEICEFCKLPYAEFNDDQVIVRVLGEKNYYLEQPGMFCLHKDELYHLMKLCWKPPLQRPTASQIHVILNNLISSSKINRNEIKVDLKRMSQDFEQRWQNLKPNSIPKKDNAVEVDCITSIDCSIISSKLKNAKIVDSSYVDSPLGIFLSNRSLSPESPRFCLKSEKELVQKSIIRPLKKVFEGESENQIDNKGKLYRAAHGNSPENSVCEIRFDTQSQILSPNKKFKRNEAEVDSWLKGVEINNEEDESFVRKISEAIRDLDATLAMEKTSSSEENSGVPSRQSSPGKDMKETDDVVVNFKLGQDTSSFMNFTQKTFELSSLQNTEQPQSLNFTDSYNNKSEEFVENYSSGSLIMPFIEENKCRSDVLDESLLFGQSRNSSDTDDEVWRRRIERGEISEKVKEKSKSIANLMILTHIDSDDSDVDFDKPFDKCYHRSSYIRRSGSFAKSLILSNNFGSESDLTFTVLEDDFKESLKKLSNDHKEHGHFDSLGVILPSYTNRENVLENFKKFSKSQNNVNRNEEGSKTETEGFSDVKFCAEKVEQNIQNENNFLGNAASEKLYDHKLKTKGDSNKLSLSKQFYKNLKEKNTARGFGKSVSKEAYSKCDSKICKTNCSDTLLNSSHIKESAVGFDVKVNNTFTEEWFLTNNKKAPLAATTEDSVVKSESFDGSSVDDMVLTSSTQDNEGLGFVPSKSKKEPLILNNQPLKQQSLEDIKNLYLKPTFDGTSKKNIKETKDFEKNEEPRHKAFGSGSENILFVPQITITEEPEEELNEAEEIFVMEKPVPKPLKFVLKEIETPDGINQIKAVENVDSESSKFLSEMVENNFKKLVPMESSTVIVGPCEDFTMDYFKGLKTTSEDVNMIRNNIVKIIQDFRNKEENLDNWDKHLEKAFTYQLNITNFDDISFRSFCVDFSEDQVIKQRSLDKGFAVSESIETCIMNFIESERLHTEKLIEPIHINRLTSLSVMTSEEEYEHFKLRTPDDERSSDSGFRDKGSLSESVEDACEGKYNLEDIEAELEEAFVKGVFANRGIDKELDLSKNSKDSNNFEYEESKFFEDENKNEDFSDIDGEIEFWQNKGESDYYPEISEFNPACSRGWYLHPPDENTIAFDRNVNEDVVNALRSELQESLPVQGRSFDEFTDFYDFEIKDSSGNLYIHYPSDFSLPLSPILEELDSSNNIAHKSVHGSSGNKVKKNILKLFESAKAIDTNTFMQYLDFMVENEGVDLYEIKEAQNLDDKKESVTLPRLVLKKMDTSEACNLNSTLGMTLPDISESSTARGMQVDLAVWMEENLDPNCPIRFLKSKTKDDVLFVNVNTEEATFLEERKLEYLSYVEKKDDHLGEETDNSENEGLVFTPEMLSPDRERSLSEVSRSSNGTRTADALSEITLSSPDLVSDCFSNFIQETVLQNEVLRITKEPKQSEISNTNDSVDNSFNSDNLYKNGAGQYKPPEEYKTQNGCFLANERNESFGPLGNLFQYSKAKLKESELPKYNKTPSNLETTLYSNDLYEMSTSFMGGVDEEDIFSGLDKFEQNQTGKLQNHRQKVRKDLITDDSDTVDWQSDESSGDEVLSSSSEEFIWKDGDRESKIKAAHVTEVVEDNLYMTVESDPNAREVVISELSPQEVNVVEEETSEAENNGNDADDNESSTGSSASITDFVPSAWNIQATPIRSALKNMNKKTDKKKNVWFKKQKYHCVYEYPREPSDNEEPDGSPYNQASCEKKKSETPIKHFTYGVNTVELPNKHFPFGISKVIDLSNYTDWDVIEGEDPDLSLTDTDSDNGSGKGEVNKMKRADHCFYNISPFDYDFNKTDILEAEKKFFVSSSSRPFQGGFSSNISPEISAESKTVRGDLVNSKDFITPDSGVEDSTNVTPSDKSGLAPENVYFKVQNVNYPNTGVVKVLNNFNFNYTPDTQESNNKEIDLEICENGTKSKNGFSSSNASISLSNNGLGELRHARGRLKLDLPRNHNVELGTLMNTEK